MVRPTKPSSLARKRGWPKTLTTKQQTAIAIMILRNTAKSMVAFIRGLLRWIALAHGAQMARAAATIRHALRRTQCVVFAQQAGTCLRKRNGIRCLTHFVVPVHREQNSNRQVAGTEAATALMPPRSRRCLPATGTTVGITTTRATTRTSGVLRSSIATTRTSCSWTAATTMQAWTTTRTMGFLFVASKTNKANIAADRLRADMTEPQVLRQVAKSTCRTINYLLCLL